MGVIAQDNGGDFAPIPIGLHRAICINVFDIGYQKGYQNDPPKHQVVILWELEPRDDTTGKRFLVTKFYGLSINEKSNLGQDLTAWRTRAFTPEELKGFDLDAIILKPCQVNVIENKNKPGKVKVGNIMPRAMAFDPVSQKQAPTSYWEPECPRTFVPAFVTKAIAEQLPPPAAPAPKAPATAGDYFTDDIPF